MLRAVLTGLTGYRHAMFSTLEQWCHHCTLALAPFSPCLLSCSGAPPPVSRRRYPRTDPDAVGAQRSRNRSCKPLSPRRDPVDTPESLARGEASSSSAGAAGLILTAGSGVKTRCATRRLAIAGGWDGPRRAQRCRRRDRHLAGIQAQGVSGRLRFVPLLPLAAFRAARLSRATGIHPPIIAGRLIGVGFTRTVEIRRTRDRPCMVEVWIGYRTRRHRVAASRPARRRFWSLLAAESLATIIPRGLAVAGRSPLRFRGEQCSSGRAAWLRASGQWRRSSRPVILGAGAASFDASARSAAASLRGAPAWPWGWLRFCRDPAAAVENAAI
jgi:hypothetical protein